MSSSEISGPAGADDEPAAKGSSAGAWPSEVVGRARGGGSSTGTGACTRAAAASPRPTEHAEIGGDDFEAGALLAFLVLPFAGLNTAFQKNQ